MEKAAALSGEGVRGIQIHRKDGREGRKSLCEAPVFVLCVTVLIYFDSGGKIVIKLEKGDSLCYNGRSKSNRDSGIST